jgi:hypothetical protein
MTTNPQSPPPEQAVDPRVPAATVPCDCGNSKLTLDIDCGTSICCASCGARGECEQTIAEATRRWGIRILAREVMRKLETPEGREMMAKYAAESKAASDRFCEAMRIPPELWNMRVTI